ncbi:hypothetical protein JTB14_033636 [Gonioctena quinquepunctata]|nr:hypothetical protein JTB14_033636 [Gonioctena quinquepunctata]
MYADDTFLLVPVDRIDTVLNVFNQYNNKIQFTVKRKNEGAITFFDTIVSQKEDGALISNWHRKPYSSGRILNHHSKQAESTKNENAPYRDINPGYLCHSNSLQYDNTSEDCIARILQISDDAAFCQHVPVTITTTLIEQLTPGHHIAIFPEPTEILINRSASGILAQCGTFLIELPTVCEFRTPRDTFINSKKVIREQQLTQKSKLFQYTTKKKLNPFTWRKYHSMNFQSCTIYRTK